MRNRAKCKLCECIIESHHELDYVSCRCGEISVYNGIDNPYCASKSWDNFLRIDDEGNEILVTIEDKKVNQCLAPRSNREELLSELDEMLKNIANLPTNAMITPITHYDFCSALILIKDILES